MQFEVRLHFNSFDLLQSIHFIAPSQVLFCSKPSLQLYSIIILQLGSMTDFLESTVLLDQTQYDEGFRDGYRDGMDSGKEDGREVGLKHGFQVGEELGFYRGCVEIWKSAIRIDPNSFSSRVQKRIDQLAELVENYPLSLPENESVQERMDAIRLGFKIISATLGVKLKYERNAFDNASKHDLEEIRV